jgi:hypothetical protein
MTSPGPPYLIRAMDVQKGTRRGSLEAWNYRDQCVIVRVLDRGEVVLAAGQWKRVVVVRRSKANLMGISQSPQLPLILF